MNRVSTTPVSFFVDAYDFWVRKGVDHAYSNHIDYDSEGADELTLTTATAPEGVDYAYY